MPPAVHEATGDVDAEHMCTSALEQRVHGLLAHHDKRAALSEIMNAYGAPVLGFCLRMLQNRVRAEDTRQQVFEQVVRDRRTPRVR